VQDGFLHENSSTRLRVTRHGARLTLLGRLSLSLCQIPLRPWSGRSSSGLPKTSIPPHRFWRPGASGHSIDLWVRYRPWLVFLGRSQSCSLNIPLHAAPATNPAKKVRPAMMAAVTDMVLLEESRLDSQSFATQRASAGCGAGPMHSFMQLGRIEPLLPRHAGGVLRTARSQVQIRLTSA
jgi:hypothetical protein